MTKLLTRWDTINGLRIFTRLSPGGEGQSHSTDGLVLVHGLGVSSRYMTPLALRVGGRIPVYAPDLPGFGKSEHADRVLNIQELAQSLCDWMDALNLERASLLGNSLGCQVAARFGLHYPERVNRIILTGPTVDPRFRSYPKIVAQAAKALLREPLRLYPLLLHDYLAAGPRAMAQVLGYAIEDPVEDYLARLPMPVLVARGERDHIASQAWVETITRLLPDGRMAVIPGGAHAPNFDAPDALAALVYSFLR